MTVRAKFKVEEKTLTENGVKVKLRAVTGGSHENETFFQHTPCGVLEMGILNETAAQEFFPGNEMYLDFTVCE